MILQFNKNSITKNFLSPISKITEECSLFINKDSISSLVNSNKEQIFLYSKINTQTGVTSDTDVKINVKEINKFIQIISCIKEDDFKLEIDDNYSVLKYQSPDMAFKMHLVTDSVIKKSPYSAEKLNSITFDTEFMMSKDKLVEILRGSSLANATNKAYFFIKDEKVYAMLTDKTIQNTDSVTFIVTDKFTGEKLNDELPFNLEFLRMLSSVKAEEIKVCINNKFKFIVFEINFENVVLKYTIPCYVK